MLPKRESRPERVTAMRAFLYDAFVDYIAARTLLLTDLLKQAAILSSTAIEKCAKAVLALHGNASPGHLKTAHWNVLNGEPHLGNLLKREFFELNQRAYTLRYSDDVPNDFNLVIASREFLAELDHTVLSVLSCFKIHKGQRHLPTGYETAIQNCDQRLTTENQLINHIPVKEFIHSKPQFVYEVRRDPLRGLFEAKYVTNKPGRTAEFLRPALVCIDSNRGEHQLSHFPIPGTESLLLDGTELVGAPLP